MKKNCEQMMSTLTNALIVYFTEQVNPVYTIEDAYEKWNPGVDDSEFREWSMKFLSLCMGQYALLDEDTPTQTEYLDWWTNTLFASYEKAAGDICLRNGVEDVPASFRYVEREIIQKSKEIRDENTYQICEALGWPDSTLGVIEEVMERYIDEREKCA